MENPGHQMNHSSFILFFKKNWALLLCSLLAILFPLFLILNNKNHFNDDWYHNLWFIGYFGEYFYQYHSFPTVFNTADLVNINIPLFYGYLIYPVLGMISSVLGANITMRLVVFLIFSLQFFTTYVLFKKITHRQWFSFGISCLSLWAIYPLTNLYNRSAIMEFFAVSLLFTSICIWLISTMQKNNREKYLLRVLFAFCFAFVVGTHPITGLFGGFFIGILFIGTLITHLKRELFWNELRSMILIVFLDALMLFPWLYCTLKFSSDLRITKSTYYLMLYTEGLDKLWVRFSPFPIDVRSIQSGIHNVSTPYLDAQMNVPMLVFLMFLTVFLLKNWLQQKQFKQNIKKEKYLVCLFFLSFILFVFFSIVSVSPSVAQIFNALIWRAQFAYRLITYQNLSVFLGMIIILLLIQKTGAGLSIKPLINLVLIACLVCSAQSVLIKLVHADSIIGQVLGTHSEGEAYLYGYGRLREGKGNLVQMPKTIYSAMDYATLATDDIQELNTTLPITKANFIVNTGGDFSKLSPINLTINETTMVGISIVPFPWSKIYINGKLLDSSKTILNNDRTYFQLEPGNYEITAEFQTDNLWKISRKVSFSVLILCGLFLLLNIRKINRCFLNSEPSDII